MARLTIRGVLLPAKRAGWCSLPSLTANRRHQSARAPIYRNAGMSDGYRVLGDHGTGFAPGFAIRSAGRQDYWLRKGNRLRCSRSKLRELARGPSRTIHDRDPYRTRYDISDFGSGCLSSDLAHMPAAIITNGVKRGTPILDAAPYASCASVKAPLVRLPWLTTSFRIRVTVACSGIRATGNPYALDTTIETSSKRNEAQ